jgi:sugar phosphate isomerase/epimerase
LPQCGRDAKVVGMLRLAFSTNAFKKHTLPETIDAIADIGYAGVEIMADVPHAYPREFDSARRSELKRQMRSRGLAVSNVNAFTLFACGDTYHPTWIEDDPAQRQVRIDHTIACIELAAELGSRTISLQPAGPLLGTSLTPDEAGKRFAEGLSRVLNSARRNDVILAIEPEPGLLIESSREYLDFRNRFFRDDPFIRMNCDIGHLYCVGEDPAESIRTLGDQVAHVHLEDIGKNRVHQHLTPGKGAIDFRSVFAALRDIRYTGWVTVELYPYETTAAGVAKLAWQHLIPLMN